MQLSGEISVKNKNKRANGEKYQTEKGREIVVDTRDVFFDKLQKDVKCVCSVSVNILRK